MKRATTKIAAVIVTAWLLPGAALATTREIADLQQAPLTFRRSVLNQLTHDLFWEPYDELQRRPYNLPFVNIDRYGNLSPWPGQEGEQDQYLNALIGNNGQTNIRRDSDVFSGAFVQQPGESLAWGVSASFVSDEAGTKTSTVTTSDALSGYDLRFGLGYRLGERFSIGGGIDLAGREDEDKERSFEDGVGGFVSSDGVDQSGVRIDVGVRGFLGDTSSWEAQIVIGTGGSERLDFTQNLDDTGAVTGRSVLVNHEVSDQFIQVAGGYNRWYAGDRGEFQARLVYGTSEHTLDNSDLQFMEAAGAVTPQIELVGQSPLSSDTLALSAGSVNYAGPTEVFSGVDLSQISLSGSTTIDSMGTVLTEAVDDQVTRFGLTLGLRQPLGTDKFRLIVSTRANFLDEEDNTIFDGAPDGSFGTETISQYGVGLEGVFSNVAFDLAWLFGEELSFFQDERPTRQIIEFDRLVVSAVFAW